MVRICQLHGSRGEVILGLQAGKRHRLSVIVISAPACNCWTVLFAFDVDLNSIDERIDFARDT